jgi:hypothetical protein
MAYNVASLVAYVDQNELKLLRQSFFANKTSKLLTIKTGIKSAEALNQIENTFQFQVDGCSFSPNGTTTFTQRILTVGRIKVQEEFCPKDLNAYYTQMELAPGSADDKLPFEEVFMGLISDQIAAQIETSQWQGDLSSGNPNLSQFDGLLKIISGCTGFVSGNTTAITSITASNVIGIIDSVYELIPTQVIDKTDMRILVGFDTFRLYTVALKNSNLYNYPVSVQDFEIVVPGTNVKIIALNGLNGTDAIVAARLSNLFYGVDLQSDEDNIKLWYSQDFQTVRLSINFKAGTQVSWCNEIVYWYDGKFE